MSDTQEKEAETVLEQAQRELREERRREAIDQLKEALRERRSWLDRLLPFTIEIKRRGQ